MSTPVVTSKWAGNFDCGVCRRKRLMADEFSKSAIEKHRKTGQPLRCKQCTAKQEQDKRAEAKARGASDNGAKNDDKNGDLEEKRKCAGKCQQILSKDCYNRNQWSKAEGKSRCRECVERSIQEEAAQQKTSKDEKLQRARKKVEDLKASKKATAMEIVAAESEVAAIEAEKVTGLAPVRLGGRGRGTRSYGRGRGRTGFKRGSGRGTGRR
ncbi:unnamed protein product [Pseudo-nitzschia multistriata]|uniref:Stc1 domain-containing protein n=1 Tax=Pseudo-nitzschia multistriata TaxID=183589 RepID=A0A448ZG63_9STRA|nr:unnamed protein product [Pseudo-nitzschia multistriata]